MSDSIFVMLAGLPMKWVVFIASAIPITELRLSVPFGILNTVDPLTPFAAWGLGILGNLLPIPILLWLWPAIYRLFDRFSFTRKFLHKYVDRARTKGHELEKYGALGLTLFVGVPLPITGVYTGSLIAYLLGLNPFYSFLSLALGVVISSTIVTFTTIGLVGVADALGGVAVVILVAVIALVGYWFYRRKKSKKKNK